jgi:hypothetical protein
MHIGLGFLMLVTLCETKEVSISFIPQNYLQFWENVRVGAGDLNR